MLVPMAGRTGRRDEEHSRVDPALGVAAEQPDMLAGEVKEGRVELNAAATDPEVLRVALVRFGCRPREDAPALVARLLRDGNAPLPNGHRLRLVASDRSWTRKQVTVVMHESLSGTSWSFFSNTCATTGMCFDTETRKIPRSAFS